DVAFGSESEVLPPLPLVRSTAESGRRGRASNVCYGHKQTSFDCLLGASKDGGTGSTFKDDLAGDKRHVRLDVLDLLFRYGHVVRGEHHEVGKLSGLDRPFSRFIEGVARGRTGVEAQGLLATNGFRSAVDASIRILPCHHDVHVEERVDRIDGVVCSG